MTTTSDIVMTVAPILGTFVGAAWWFKRWIARVDKQLEDLSVEVHKLSISDAVSKENKAHLVGSIDQLQKAVSGTNKDLGRVTASIDKLWQVLESTPQVSLPRRASDPK